MDARTTPFTRLPGALAHQAEHDMLHAIERGDVAGDRVMLALLRAVGATVATVPGNAAVSALPVRPSPATGCPPR